jgi:hypothetical protein
VIEAALASQALAGAASELVKQFAKGYRAEGSEQEITLEVAGHEIHISAEQMTPELQAVLASAETHDAPDNPVELAREASARVEQEPTEVASEEARLIAAVALAISPESVFQDARRRANAVYRFHLVTTIALAGILIGAVICAVVFSVVSREPIWLLVFGGVSAADVLGLYLYKPLTVMRDALVATQRIDTAYLRLQQQLDACSQYTDLTERISCQTAVWDKVTGELTSLAAPTYAGGGSSREA